MARSLAATLRESNCLTPIAEFQDLIETLHQKHFPQWTVDEMLLHPEEAQFLCKDVRNQQKDFADIPDDLILRALLDRRKHPA